MEEVKIIQGRQAWEFLKDKHYAGRKPQISKAFGWYENNELVGVCTFGKPVSNSLCKSIVGEEYSKNVYELNRLCKLDRQTNKPLSWFVAKCLNNLKQFDYVIVSYSDTGMSHHGYIYQACNFIYTGCTKERTDIWTGKHSRHYTDEQAKQSLRVIRTAKHRYVYFATNNKYLKQEWLKKLSYKQCDYPKGDNKKYTLGEFIKPILIERNK